MHISFFIDGNEEDERGWGIEVLDGMVPRKGDVVLKPPKDPRAAEPWTTWRVTEVLWQMHYSDSGPRKGMYSLAFPHVWVTEVEL